MIRRPPRSTQSRSSAASDVYKRQALAEHLRAEGHRRVKSKIDAKAFKNWILDLRAEGEEEIALEEKQT